MSDGRPHEEVIRLLQAERLDEAIAVLRVTAETYRARGQTDAYLRTLCSLGGLLEQQNHSEAALSLLRQAADAAEGATVRPETGCTVFLRLSQVLRQQGKLDEAEAHLRRASQETRGANLGPEYRHAVFDARSRLARQRGRIVEAERWLLRAAKLARKARLGALTCVNAFLALGDTFRVQGEHRQAERWLLRAARLAREKTLNPLARCQAFVVVGDLYREQGKAGEAERWLLRAARLARREKLGPLCRSNAYRALGYVLADQGKYPLAEEWLRRAAGSASEAMDATASCNAFVRLAEVLGTQGKNAEAKEWLSRTDELARCEPLGAIEQCNIARVSGTMYREAGRWRECVDSLSKSQEWLLKLLSENRRPGGMGNVLANYEPIFSYGREASEILWQLDSDAKWLWQALDFVDGQKCVSIREGLRRHGPRIRENETAPHPWRSGPLAWRDLFDPKEPSDGKERSDRGAVRGVRAGSPPPAAEGDRLLELPEEVADADKQKFCQAFTRDDIGRLLPDPQTVLVVFSFQGDDLTVLPIRKDRTTGEPTILHPGNGLFRVPGAKGVLQRLARIQSDALDYLLSDAGLPASELQQSGMTEDLYQRLYEELHLGDLLILIEGGRGNLDDLHLILVPDGLLYQFPLHAAYSASAHRALYEQVKSLRYALSLRTLELQHQIEEQRRPVEGTDRHFRGVLFANPNRDTAGKGSIPAVVQEVENLVAELGIECWWIHGEREPERSLRASYLKRHSAGNVLWHAAHGGHYPDLVISHQRQRATVDRPATLLCDGPVSDSRMVAEGYDFLDVWLLHFSCCLLGKLREEERSKELEGFIASLTLLGCRRVTSAMWHISDLAGAEFARHWARALLRHVFTPGGVRGPHAFAIAFKEALTSFRRHDGGYFDHEFYWAPYTLYGLG